MVVAFFLRCATTLLLKVADVLNDTHAVLEQGLEVSPDDALCVLHTIKCLTKRWDSGNCVAMSLQSTTNSSVRCALGARCDAASVDLHTLINNARWACASSKPRREPIWKREREGSKRGQYATLGLTTVQNEV